MMSEIMCQYSPNPNDLYEQIGTEWTQPLAYPARHGHFLHSTWGSDYIQWYILWNGSINHWDATNQWCHTPAVALAGSSCRHQLIGVRTYLHYFPQDQGPFSELCVSKLHCHHHINSNAPDIACAITPPCKSIRCLEMLLWFANVEASLRCFDSERCKTWCAGLWIILWTLVASPRLPGNIFSGCRC